VKVPADSTRERAIGKPLQTLLPQVNGGTLRNRHSREIRGLARRSAAAARQIKDLIQDSVKKVEDETVRVAQSAWTLEQIVAAANSARHHTVHAVINLTTQE
jgi:hypothetical protein